MAGGPPGYLAAGVKKALVHVRLDCAGGQPQQQGVAFVVKRQGARAYLVSSWNLFHPAREKCQIEEVHLQGGGVGPIDAELRGRSLDELFGLHGNRDADIALLSAAADPEGPSLPLGAYDFERYGKAELLTVGFAPAGDANTLPAATHAAGMISSGSAADQNRLSLSLQGEPGLFGGPVMLAATGQVIGVLGGRQPNGGAEYVAATLNALAGELHDNADLDLYKQIAPAGLDRLPHAPVTRPEEVAINRELLRRSPAPFVLVHGASGIGKGALANKLAWEHLLSGQFPDGVVRIAVRDRSTNEILGELHRSVLRRAPSLLLSETVKALAAALRGRRMLVVLDDLRWESDRLPNELLQALAETAVLATSRRRYTDARIQLVELGNLSPELGRRVLRANLSEAQNHALSDADVNQIGQRLDYNALALALIAEVLNRSSLTLDELIERLQGPRQRNLGEDEEAAALSPVLEVDYAALNSSERSTLIGLGLLAEALTPPELLAVILGEEQPIIDAALEHLIALQLVDRPLTGREVRLHPLIYAFAKAKAEETWFRSRKRDRLVQWFLALPSTMNAQSYRPFLGAHLRAAQEWAARDGRPLEVFQLAEVWNTWLSEQGPWPLWDQLWRNAVEAALRSDDRQTLMVSLRRLARVREQSGYSSGAESLYQDSLKLARENHEQRLVIEMLNELGQRVEPPARGVSLLTESLTEARSLGDPLLTAATIEQLSLAYERAPDYPNAEKYALEALATYQQLGKTEPAIVILRNLSTLAEKKNDAAQAKVWLRRSIDVCEKASDARCAITSYLHLGRLLDKQHEVGEAQRQFDRALTLARTAQDTGYLAEILDELSSRQELKEDFESALVLWLQARDSVNKSGDSKRAAAIAVHGAKLAYLLRDFSGAEALLVGALRSYAQLGERRIEMAETHAMNYLRWSRLGLADQLDLVRDAKQQAELSQSNEIMAAANLALSRIWRLRKEPMRAEALITQSAQFYAAKRDAWGLAQATAARAALAALVGDHAATRVGFTRAMLLCEKGLEGTRLFCLKDVADEALSIQQWPTAQKALERILFLLRGKGQPVQIVNAVEDLGDLALARGDRPGARKRFEEALALWQRLHANLGVARMLERLAWLSWQRGDLPMASEWLHESLTVKTVAERKNDSWGRLRLLQAQIALRQKQVAQARTLASEAAELFERLHAPELATARTLLQTIDAPPGRKAP